MTGFRPVLSNMLILISIEILDFHWSYIKIFWFQEIRYDVIFKSFVMPDVNKLIVFANFRNKYLTSGSRFQYGLWEWGFHFTKCLNKLVYIKSDKWDFKDCEKL